MSYHLQFGAVTPYLPLLVKACAATLGITALGTVTATLVGMGLAVARLARWRWPRPLARGLTDVLRGIPALVLILYVYYGVSAALFIDLGELSAGIIALGLYYGSYLAETFRAGIQAVDSGEIEAGAALGMTPGLVFLRIVLPQAFRIILPPYAGYAIGMLKDSSLVSVIGVVELTRQGELIESATFRPFEVYTVVAGTYLAFSICLSAVIGHVENRLRQGQA